MELSRFLCEKIYEIRELSERDRDQIKSRIMDYFAAAFAGYQQNKLFSDKVETVIFSKQGKQEASILFRKDKYPVRTAAFMNSLYGHGAELDDGNKKAMGHVGVHIIPAVLALGEAYNKSQDEIMVAIAVGYEAYIRISSAAQPGMVNRSFHSTGMAGAPACAIACAKLLGLDVDGIESAMSLACTMSSGLLTYSESQQMIKPLNPAKAAETGVFAAELAAAGITGPQNSLEGPHGWFEAVTDSIDEKMITDAWDCRLIHDCYIKLYPSCRHTHCVIEAAINLYKKIDVGCIKKINVYIYPNAIKLAGQIKQPKDADETKFSIHYTLACALLYGEYGVGYMNPPRTDGKILEIIQKIELIPDESMENRKESIRGACISLELKDGSVHKETVLIPKGDPEKPLTHGDIVNKLQACATSLVYEKDIITLIEYINNFGGNKVINVDKLFCKGSN